MESEDILSINYDYEYELQSISIATLYVIQHMQLKILGKPRV